MMEGFKLLKLSGGNAVLRPNQTLWQLAAVWHGGVWVCLFVLNNVTALKRSENNFLLL